MRHYISYLLSIFRAYVTREGILQCSWESFLWRRLFSKYILHLASYVYIHIYNRVSYMLTVWWRNVAFTLRFDDMVKSMYKLHVSSTEKIKIKVFTFKAVFEEWSGVVIWERGYIKTGSMLVKTLNTRKSKCVETLSVVAIWFWWRIIPSILS